MGNIGSIEKVMVFGILVIIVTILGIAFYSATKVDNDLTANQMDAGGQDPVVLLDGPGTVEPPIGDRNQPTSQKPVVRDVRPGSTIEGTLNDPAGHGSGDYGGGNGMVALNSTLPQNTMQDRGRNQGGDRNQGIERNRSSDIVRESPVVQPKPKKGPETYTVKKGDSFMSIARAVFGDERKFKLLMEANPDVDPMSLQIGQKLTIPEMANAKTNKAERKTSRPSVVGGQEVGNPISSDQYVVKSGDTLASISLAIYGTSKKWKKIYEANRTVISNPDVLSVGDVLRLPPKN